MEMKGKRRLGDLLVDNLTSLRDELRKGGRPSPPFSLKTVTFNMKPKPYDAAAVKRIRERLGMSQAVFAAVLDVSVDTVQSWEQGINQPPGIACRFLDQLNRDPQIAAIILNEASDSGIDSLDCEGECATETIQ
jgi:putative transcriptional regulator